MRIGQALGRGVGGILRSEKALWSTFSRIGLPSLIVTPVKWAVRVAVIGTGACFAAWGLLYAIAIILMVAVASAAMTNLSTGNALKPRFVNDEDLPYGMESNVFGQTKGWFESENEYK